MSKTKAGIERQKLVKRYSYLYKKDNLIDKRKCFYCKDLFHCYDHRPAISTIPYLNLKDFKDNGGVFELIPCCKQCNLFLYNKQFSTKFESLIYLLDKYDKKIKNMAEWTEEEISELGRSLVGVIEKGRVQREYIMGKMNGIITTINEIETELGYNI